MPGASKMPLLAWLGTDSKESHGTLLKTSLLDFNINLTLKIEAINSIENWGSRFYNFKMDPKLVLGCYTTVSHTSVLVGFV